MDHNNPQLTRDHNIFKSLPNFISSNSVEIFPKVHKTIKQTNFIIVTFLNNDSKSDKMVNSRVMSPKTNLSFRSFSLAFKPKAKLLLQNEPIKLGQDMVD